MTQDTDKPKPRRPRKRVLSRRVMISVNESLYSALERVADDHGVPLAEVGRRAIRSGLKVADRDLKRLHGRVDTSGWRSFALNLLGFTQILQHLTSTGIREECGLKRELYTIVPKKC